jgi:hypothetical protein
VVVQALMMALALAPLDGEKPIKVRKPRAELLASARAGMAPLKVHFTLLVRDPDRQIVCVSEASWAWAWNGEVRGSARGISDCDPFALPENTPTSWTERRSLKLSLPGAWKVAACLRGMGGGTVCDSVTLDVR